MTPMQIVVKRAAFHFSLVARSVALPLFFDATRAPAHALRVIVAKHALDPVAPD